MSEIRYCVTGCTKNGNKIPTDSKSNLCRRCEDNIHNWLTKIPDLYALLPGYTLPGTVEKNPDSKATKKAQLAAPLRLEVIDLLDNRKGRIWLGTAPARGRRGVAGTLQAHVDTLRERRPLTTSHDDTNIAAACALLDRHRLWIAEQDWVTYLHDDLKQTHRDLSEATGDYRRPPVGHCHVIPDEADQPCRGPLFANTYGGVRCAKCGATWDATHLRQLGLAQAQAALEKEAEPA